MTDAKAREALSAVSDTEMVDYLATLGAVNTKASSELLPEIKALLARSGVAEDQIERASRGVVTLLTDS